MLENGFGEHNIQGIGDKHIPLIHNVMNTDVVVGGQRPGHRRARRAVQHRRRAGLPRRPRGVVRTTSSTRSSTSGSRRSATCWPRSRPPSCSTSGPTTRSITVATDGAALYPSERAKTLARALRRRRSTDVDAAEVFGRAPRRRRHRPHDRAAPSATATGSSTSATTRGSSSRARRSSCSRPAARRRSGAGCAASSAVWDEMIAEFNAARRRRADVSQPRSIGWSLRGLRRRRSTSPTPLAVALPERRPTPTVTTCCSCVPTARARCADVDDPNPFVAFGAAAGVGRVRRRPRHDRRRRGRARAPGRRAVDAGGRRRLPRHAVRPGRRAVRRARLHRRRRRVGEGRDRQRRPAATRPGTSSRSCCTCWRPSRWLGAWAVGATAAARHRLVRQRRARRGDAGRRRRLAARGVRPAVRPTGGARRGSTSCGAEIVDVPAARRRPARRSVRATASARPSPPGRCRSACRDRRTRWCLDGGRTIGWEMADSRGGAEPLDRVFVQVGGGALAACVGAGLPSAASAAAAARRADRGCAPLARAWERRGRRSAPAAAAALGRVHVAVGGRRRARRADGILDDETYDWLGVRRRRWTRSGGSRRRGAEAADRRGARARPVGDGHPGRAPPARPAWPACSPSAARSADDERVAVDLQRRRALTGRPLGRRAWWPSPPLGAQSDHRHPPLASPACPS